MSRRLAAQVAWLKDRLETLGPRLDPHRQRRCADHFARMLRLEIAFHDAPYEAPRPPGSFAGAPAVRCIVAEGRLRPAQQGVGVAWASTGRAGRSPSRR